MTINSNCCGRESLAGTFWPTARKCRTWSNSPAEPTCTLWPRMPETICSPTVLFPECSRREFESDEVNSDDIAEANPSELIYYFQSLPCPPGWRNWQTHG